MCYTGLVKRFVPFFLTFAAGLFIASLFVPIAAPSFNFRRGPGRYGEMQRLRNENMDLRRSNCELRRQMEELRNATGDVPSSLDLPYEVDVPPPPPPPVYRGHGYGSGSGSGISR